MSRKITDSTKIQSYMRCPRMYYFEHYLGWRSAYPNNHLEFGKALHEGLYELFTGSSLEHAMEIFESVYRENFPPETDDLYAPKTVKNGFKALIEFSEKLPNILSRYKMLEAEVGGVISLGKFDGVELEIAYKIDLILYDIINDYIIPVDHKTKKDSVTQYWYRQWTNSVQMNTYTYVAYCLYPEKRVYGAGINPFGFLKTRIDNPEFHLMRKNKNDLIRWYNNLVYYMRMLQLDLNTVECTDPEAPAMDCFYQNFTQCGNFFGCPYLDYCAAWNNPIGKEVPPDMQIFFWNPLEEVRVEHNIEQVVFEGLSEKKEHSE